MPETVLVALVAACSAVGGRAIDRLFDVWSARRSGLGPARDLLVATLRDTVSAQAARITTLEADLAAATRRSDALKQRVNGLEAALDECLGSRRRTGRSAASG
ncbi:MAG: hypothetical protein EPN50_07080 [Chloroflexota bacterium]|nr:MAG: hypothetical protein EPN50_07080 [Chloroflexota bacterium]